MCETCDHPQRAAIEHDIRQDMAPATVRKKYGLRHHLGVVQHERRHMREIPAVLGIVESEPMVEHVDMELARVQEMAAPAVFDVLESEHMTKPLDIVLARIEPKARPVSIDDEHTEPPFTRFKQAWKDVKDDQRERARMIAWLNEQIQTDDMGLP